MDQSSTKEQKYLMDHIKLEFLIRIIGGGGCGAESVSHAKKQTVWIQSFVPLKVTIIMKFIVWAFQKLIILNLYLIHIGRWWSWWTVIN